MTAWVVGATTPGPPPLGVVVVDWDGTRGVLLAPGRRPPRLPPGFEYLGDAHASPVSARLELLANRREPPMTEV